ncbi:MAG: hypothetical protein IJ242_16350 [Clostridia bacterium]|nr:hypothetical protein [Clostridia bacterium]
MDKAFLNTLFNDMERERLAHAGLEAADIIKFLFQGMMGPGHMLGPADEVIRRLETEMSDNTRDAEEPLLVPVGPAYVRLNLRPAVLAGLTAKRIAALMQQAASPQCTRAETAEICMMYVARLSEPLQSETRKAAMRLTEENGLPAHSDSYHKRYSPSYRIISRNDVPLLSAVAAIERLTQDEAADRKIVTLDGPCASGKTTAAGRLAVLFDAPVIHTDDYVIPHAAKIAQRLSIPGGNCDWERLLTEVMVPFKASRPVLVRPYDCHADRILEGVPLQSSGLLILEGSYVNLPEIRALSDLSLFAQVSSRVRMDRLTARETPESLQMFEKRWIPLEDAYFSAYHLPDEQCLCIRTEGLNGESAAAV